MSEEIKKKMRTIHVTVQEKDDGKNFQFYLTGDCDRIGRIPDDQLDPVEFVASQVFRAGLRFLQSSGAVQAAKPKIMMEP